MPTLVACLWRRVEAIQPGRVPTRFGPATRLRRPKSPWNQGALATSQVEMCLRTANSGQSVGLGLDRGRGAERVVAGGERGGADAAGGTRAWLTPPGRSNAGTLTRARP